MESLIYYPGFSIQDERWLKYALLYLDEIRPIVPDADKWKNELNEMTCCVYSETDLLRECTPSWTELDDSSRVAISVLLNFLESPDMLAYALCGVPSLSKGEEILRNWRNSEYQVTQLYNKKYAYALLHFCIEHNLCRKNDDGLMLPSQLANMYMSILANEIACQRDLDIITDVEECNRVILEHERLVRRRMDTSFDVAQSEIDYYLPCDLDAISLERIIHMRNDPDFRAIRRAFSKQIEQMIQSRENFDYKYSFDEMVYAKKHLVDYLLKTFDTLAVVVASAVSFGALSNGFQGEDIMPLALSAYTDWRATRSVYREIKATRSVYDERRLARKYITEIRNLNRPTIRR